MDTDSKSEDNYFVPRWRGEGTPWDPEENDPHPGADYKEILRDEDVDLEEINRRSHKEYEEIVEGFIDVSEIDTPFRGRETRMVNDWDEEDVERAYNRFVAEEESELNGVINGFAYGLAIINEVNNVMIENGFDERRPRSRVYDTNGENPFFVPVNDFTEDIERIHREWQEETALENLEESEGEEFSRLVEEFYDPTTFVDIAEEDMEPKEHAALFTSTRIATDADGMNPFTYGLLAATDYALERQQDIDPRYDD